MSIQEDLNNIKTNEEINEEVNEDVNNEKVNEEVDEKVSSKSKNQTVKTKRSDPTKGELVALAKKRAIENFEKGIADPEYRVTKMTNGKYRCYKRKVDLPPEPVKQDQIPKNVRSSATEQITEQKTDETKNKDKHDPFADIVYFNLNNQMNEQVNKRLDLINHEIEKLHSKNTKLKGKYKQLKQAIYVTDSDEEGVSEHENESSTPAEPSTPMTSTEPVMRRRTNGINFNQFFK